MELSPISIYRETNFPLYYVDFLLKDKIAGKYRAYLENHQKVEVETKELTDILEKQVKEIDSDDLRKKVINLKRDLHNMRASAYRRLEAISEGIEVELLESIKAVLDKQEKLRKEYLNLEEEFQKLYIEERENIRSTFLVDEALRNSIILTNDTIIGKLKKYLDKPINKHDRNLEKLDSVLVKFLTRAVMKTSPLANLTYSGIGYRGTNKKGEKKLYARISNNIILRIFDEICKEPVIMEQLSYRVCKTLMQKDGKYYVTVLRNPNDNDTLHMSSQVVYVFNHNSVFEALFEKVSEQKEVSFKEMMEFLETLGLQQDKAKKVLNNLIGQSVLERTDYLDEQAESIIQEIIYYLKKYGYDEVFISELEEVEKLLEDFGDSIDYKKVMNIYTKIEALAAKVNIGELKRRNLLYIDGIDHKLEDNYGKLDATILDPLSYYQLIAMSLDPIVRMQFITGEYFKQKYNKEVNPKDSREMSKVLRELSEVFSFGDDEKNMFLGDYNWEREFANKDVAMLNEFSKKLIYYIKDHTSDSEVVLNREYMEESIKPVRALISKDIVSHSFFVQQGEEGKKLVINHLYKGYGIYFSRFLKYLDSLDDKYNRYIDKYFNSIGVTDIRNTFGFNANVRAELSNRYFNLPFGYGKQSENALGWEDLGFRYNEYTKKVELFHKGTGETIRTQFLGTLISLATPSLMNIFDMLSSHSTIYFDLGELVLRTIVKDDSYDKDKVIRIPRISMGDGGEVVVSRAKWVLSSEHLLNSSNINNKFELWSKIIQSFDTEGIPMKFYVRAYTMDINDISIGKSDRKPQFINLDSPHLFELFVQTLQKNKHIIIEEELPISEAKGKYVKEYIYEITSEGGVVNESSKMLCI
jgi:hypothetical protein